MVFQDETGFSLHPRLGRIWGKRGERVRIPTTSQHQHRLNLSGWVAPLLGRFGMIRTPKGNREGFLMVLRQIAHRLTDYTVWLYVDGARWHKGEPIRQFLRKHPTIHLDYLPAYQPALNPQERVWRRMRYEGTTNRWFDHLQDIWATIRRTTRSWSPQKIKRLCRII